MRHFGSIFLTMCHEAVVLSLELERFCSLSLVHCCLLPPLATAPHHYPFVPSTFRKEHFTPRKPNFSTSAVARNGARLLRRKCVSFKSKLSHFWPKLVALSFSHQKVAQNITTYTELQQQHAIHNFINPGSIEAWLQAGILHFGVQPNSSLLHDDEALLLLVVLVSSLSLSHTQNFLNRSSTFPTTTSSCMLSNFFCSQSKMANLRWASKSSRSAYSGGDYVRMKSTVQNQLNFWAKPQQQQNTQVKTFLFSPLAAASKEGNKWCRKFVQCGLFSRNNTRNREKKKVAVSHQKYFAFQWLSKRKLFNASSLVELLWFDLQQMKSCTASCIWQLIFHAILVRW